MDILTDQQQKFLQAFSNTELKDAFFLTGGTALSAFYLQPRLSEDLGFFTEQPDIIPLVLPILEDMATHESFEIEVRRQFKSYLEVHLHFDEQHIIRCDTARDAPYRLKPVRSLREFGIFVDNELDISCNKLSAFYDRAEAKDFVDIFFIQKYLIPFDKLLKSAKKKHIGLDNYWLAISFHQVEDLGPLPKMIKPLDIKELKDFFLEQAKHLME